MLLFLTLGLPALIFAVGVFDLALGTRIAQTIGRDPWIILPLIGGILIYHLFALKRVYRQGWVLTSAKAIILTTCVMALVPFVCRPILFFMAFYAS